jgi:protein involved in polysaccharide export with SLBB domain
MNRWWYLIVAATVVFTGCLADTVDSKKMARYRPQVTDSSTRLSDRTPDGTARLSGADNTHETGGSQRRPLKKSDAVSISIHDIPSPMELRAVIDDRGSVNLPLIGEIKIEGRTASEAQRMIERAYITGGYYKKINVNVVAESPEYFIRGEVEHQGKYPLSPDLTLLRAITEAGGYTEYADHRDVKILRGDDASFYDAKKIEDRKADDPLIKPGDIIVVGRKMI